MACSRPRHASRPRPPGPRPPRPRRRGRHPTAARMGQHPVIVLSPAGRSGQDRRARRRRRRLREQALRGGRALPPAPRRLARSASSGEPPESTSRWRPPGRPRQRRVQVSERRYTSPDRYKLLTTLVRHAGKGHDATSSCSGRCGGRRMRVRPIPPCFHGAAPPEADRLRPPAHLLTEPGVGTAGRRVSRGSNGGARGAREGRVDRLSGVSSSAARRIREALKSTSVRFTEAEGVVVARPADRAARAGRARAAVAGGEVEPDRGLGSDRLVQGRRIPSAEFDARGSTQVGPHTASRRSGRPDLGPHGPSCVRGRSCRVDHLRLPRASTSAPSGCVSA